MHELAITESLVEAVREHVGAQRVTRVVIEVGRLSGVVPDSVLFCFELCARGTALEGSKLEIIEIPGRASCRACREVFAMRDAIGLCACGSADVELLNGQELRIREVEVV